MANRLAKETSPYLLQHAENPVDWYPWGPEALERAKRDDRPILLSIGYAACHWCHVMEHESFEDLATAMLMNDRFVCIKVDREERPDLDSLYMQAVQAMTGHGGWPMTVFLTPEGVPYYGGTYFPKEEQHGMPSFTRVLSACSNAYANRREDVDRTTASVREMYASIGARPTRAGALTSDIFDRAVASLRTEFDATHGGFGGAPKFPPTMTLEWLLVRWARSGDESALEMARTTFLMLARGGIHDQVGGGFARYSVDAEWLVPHFEKMLYDNALLIRLGAHLWQATRDEEIRHATLRTIAWVGREMTSPDGGFYSSYDADSEGEEGKFYVWSLDTLREALGDDADLMIAYWGVTAGGNFEGHNILNVPVDPAEFASRHGMRIEALRDRVSAAATRLCEQRATRVWPGRDDKILASWNGFMIRALSEAARILDSADARALAVAAGEFAFSTLVRAGRVLRTAKGRDARIAGFLEDYASLALAALSLYELTFDAAWLTRAQLLASSMRDLFWDTSVEAFFDTAFDQETLVARPRDVTDNAVPSGTSMAADLLLRLGALSGDSESTRTATRVLETVAEPMARYPLAFGNMLGAADMLINGAIEVALVGEPGSHDHETLVRTVRDQYVPALVLASGVADVALLRDRPMVDGRATAYVCRRFACDAPTSDPTLLSDQLTAAARIGTPLAPG